MKYGLGIIVCIVCLIGTSFVHAKTAPAPVVDHSFHGKAKKRNQPKVVRHKTISKPIKKNIAQPKKTAQPVTRKPSPVKASGVHVVKKGETMYSISRHYQMPLTQLATKNHLRSPYTLAVGQKLAINQGAAPAQRKAPIAVAAKKAVPKTAPARSSAYFGWPVKGQVLSQYGPKKNGLHNDGINIKASKGAKVGAAENGIVEYVGGMKGFDNLVIIRHKDYMSAYAHLGKISVGRGANVSKGQQIGTVGEKEKVPQIHFEIRKGKKAINPMTLLR